MIKEEKYSWFKHVPEGYKSTNIVETQKEIQAIKRHFPEFLSNNLNLTRASSPLFLKADSGLNDGLSGCETPVGFTLPDGTKAEVPHSLAKWKRFALKYYGFETQSGLYADMNAIRKDEVPDNTHSFYVDQWDWEKIMNDDQRTDEYLESTVKSIYSAMLEMEDYLANNFNVKKFLPKEISFITSQELLDMYPDLTSEEREEEITKEKGAIFVKNIGGVLSNNEPHDLRAPDYDDWNLNGDIIVYHPVLKKALEISSMGIRVNRESLLKQLELAGKSDMLSLPFHKMLESGQLPQTVGGGIGQSRLCMLLLGKVHLGEVQSSIWDDKTQEFCEENDIILL